MKVSRTTIIVSVLTVILALTAIPAISQDKPTDTMQIVREKARADKKLFVAVNLQLTDSEAEAFWPIYDSYQKELDNLTDRFIKLIEDYARNYETMSDEVAVKLLDEYLAIEGEHQRLRQSYLPKFREALPEKKVVRYYQLENKIDAVVDYELAANIPLVE
jgi:hypothetical protein